MTSASPNAIESHGASVIQPPATIGMVGGGQLGRMFAMAAASMGYEVVVFCESDDEPAAQVAHRCVTGRLDDHHLASQFASRCDVISLEFENIPAETIAICAQHAPTFPDASVLAIAQDRLKEKGTLRAAGLPVTPFAAIDSSASFQDAAAQLGWPLIVKTARSGYDGKGQHRLESAANADQIDWTSGQRWIAERCIDFEREISVIVARTSSGQTRCFPAFENAHRNHILDLSMTPAAITATLAGRAEEVAIAVAQAVDMVGLLCVEFFVRNGEVMINEIAPRPHNSGHLTIEACHTSQFQQHVRAICNLPLGDPALKCPAAAMANLLGDLWDNQGAPDWSKVAAVDDVNLHLYGKRSAKPGRKMGHLTAVGESPQQAAERVVLARESLRR